MVSSRCIYSQTISCSTGYSTFAGLSQGFCACVLTAHTLAVKCLQCIKSHLVLRPHQLEGHDILPWSLLSLLDLAKQRACMHRCLVHQNAPAARQCSHMLYKLATQGECCMCRLLSWFQTLHYQTGSPGFCSTAHMCSPHASNQYALWASLAQNTCVQRRRSELGPTWLTGNMSVVAKTSPACFVQAAAMVDQALQTQIEALLHSPPSPAFYTRMNPGRLLGAVRLFLGAVGQSPGGANEPVSPLLTRCEKYACISRPSC